MNATFEEVSASVRALRPGDRYQLWVQLSEEFDSTADEAEIEAAWDRELEQRVKDVQEGRVELIPGDEFLRHVRAAATVAPHRNGTGA